MALEREIKGTKVISLLKVKQEENFIESHSFFSNSYSFWQINAPFKAPIEVPTTEEIFMFNSLSAFQAPT